MPNPDFNAIPNDRGGKGGGPAKKTRGGMGSVNEKTAAWPGLPGKAQPKSRNAGIKKCPVYPKSEGL